MSAASDAADRQRNQAASYKTSGGKERDTATANAANARAEAAKSSVTNTSAAGLGSYKSKRKWNPTTKQWEYGDEAPATAVTQNKMQKEALKAATK